MHATEDENNDNEVKIELSSTNMINRTAIIIRVT